jgi:hypothetical protein
MFSEYVALTDENLTDDNPGSLLLLQEAVNARMINPRCEILNGNFIAIRFKLLFLEMPCLSYGEILETFHISELFRREEVLCRRIGKNEFQGLKINS